MNCGLTRFLRGYYTLSLWSVSPQNSPQTTSFTACFRNSSHTGGNRPMRNVPYFDYALFPNVGIGIERSLRLGRECYTAAVSATCNGRSSAIFISIYKKSVFTEPSLRRASDEFRLQSNPKQARLQNVAIFILPYFLKFVK